MNDPLPVPEQVRVSGRTILELHYPNGSRFDLPAEYLRVYAPSADVRGHGGVGAVLVTGKRDVAIVAVEPVGNYALRIRFSDGHRNGLYTWKSLLDLVYPARNNDPFSESDSGPPQGLPRRQGWFPFPEAERRGGQLSGSPFGSVPMRPWRRCDPWKGPAIPCGSRITMTTWVRTEWVIIPGGVHTTRTGCSYKRSTPS